MPLKTTRMFGAKGAKGAQAPRARGAPMRQGRKESGSGRVRSRSVTSPCWIAPGAQPALTLTLSSVIPLRPRCVSARNAHPHPPWVAEVTP